MSHKILPLQWEKISASTNKLSFVFAEHAKCWNIYVFLLERHELLFLPLICFIRFITLCLLSTDHYICTTWIAFYSYYELFSHLRWIQRPEYQPNFSPYCYCSLAKKVIYIHCKKVQVTYNKLYYQEPFIPSIIFHLLFNSRFPTSKAFQWSLSQHLIYFTIMYSLQANNILDAIFLTKLFLYLKKVLEIYV